MRLIGMLDSPYVRRVAVCLQLLQLPFEHESLSVFRGWDRFREINPVVKAPTLVCDDGVVLMDSALILDYAAALARPRKLLPDSTPELKRALRIIGLALAACEKSGQIVYEMRLRPPEKQHEPWLSRVTEQLLAAFEGLDAEFARQAPAADSETIDLAGVTSAVAWYFARQMQPELLVAGKFPRLEAFSAAAEALPEFQAAPHGDRTYRKA